DGSTPPTGSILLVEDDPKDVEFTLAAFKASRLVNPVQVVSDGAAALEILAATDARAKAKDHIPPQLVLLDLHLPKLHGLEVLRRIRADRRLKQIPVVVL